MLFSKIECLRLWLWRLYFIFKIWLLMKIGFGFAYFLQNYKLIKPVPLVPILLSLGLCLMQLCRLMLLS